MCYVTCAPTLGFSREVGLQVYTRAVETAPESLGAVPLVPRTERLLRPFDGERRRGGSMTSHVSKESLGRLVALSRTTTLFDDLLAEMVAKGEAGGQARAVLRVLVQRFGPVHGALTDRVLAERDLQTLDCWLDLAVAAASLAYFARVVPPAP